MIVVERTFAVTAAPGPVHAYLADYANTSQWDPSVRQTTRSDDGPPVPGSTWHHVGKVCGITAELVCTLITVEPQRLLFHGRNEGTARFDTVTLLPAPDGTEVTYRVELEIHGLAKLATPLLKIEFEKLATESVTRLTGALNGLAAPRATELHFPAPALNPTPTRSREAQA
jgi:carbon monoxide dehydrogenase subunit G